MFGWSGVGVLCGYNSHQVMAAFKGCVPLVVAEMSIDGGCLMVVVVRLPGGGGDAYGMPQVFGWGVLCGYDSFQITAAFKGCVPLVVA